MADKTYSIKDIPWKDRPAYIWEYYKYHIIITLIFIIAVISLYWTISTQEKYDSVILFSTSGVTVDDQVFARLENGIADMDIDNNGDGISTVEISDILMYDNALSSENAPESSALMNRFFAELTSGECTIEIADEDMFNLLLKNDVVGKYESLDNNIKGSGLIKIPYDQTGLEGIVPMSTFNKQLFVTIRPGDINNQDYLNQVMIFKKLLNK